MPKHASLRHDPAELVGGEWRPIPGASMVSRNPARPSQLVWTASPSASSVSDAVLAATRAQRAWASAGFDARARVLRRFQQIAREREQALAELICDETGKVLWDAKAEAALLATKVDITLDMSSEGSLRRVTSYELALSPTRVGRCDFRPHGVMAVVGPFNFPAHLPNGHIIPALAMGNTIVFKPSDKTPGVGQLLVEMFDEACRAEGAPTGVVNLIQGGASVASALVSHEQVDGVLFTGSWAVGRRIMEANLDRPGRLLALEMGGSNPAIVMDDADLAQAVVECVRSAFISTGQRCTCTRRLIVHRSVASQVIPAVCTMASQLMIGDPRAAHPVFMGPMISAEAAEHAIRQVQAMAQAGGDVLVPMRRVEEMGEGGFVTPGVMRVERFTRETTDAGADIEVFAPFFRVTVVDTLDDAIAQANATGFGLAASIFSRNASSIERFVHETKAGCLNVNTGTAGASSKLPFGGLGLSGNHRPAGAFSLDYCAAPVGSMIERGSASTLAPGMRFDPAWIT
jgi:succinylglutamic semialdehyde dehydrogenase